MDLGCAEFSTPGRTLKEKLGVLEKNGMWLELVNDDRDFSELPETLASYDTSIKSVQAYQLHDLQFLSKDKGERKAAVKHVEESLELASRINAENVIVVIAYGAPEISNPGEKCVEIFRKLGRVAEDYGVTASLEPLGIDRTSFLPTMSEVHNLVREVDSPGIRLMADTMHIHVNENDVASVINEYASELTEVQLRDTDSKPPGKGEINFEEVLKVIRDEFNGLLVLEYKISSNSNEDLSEELEYVMKNWF
ncbi:MAG: sugar phosphate isomerase/epimerase [Hadesarchaea archaeon]|nr:sugar phosphate isomerase/epimerase [Hadesarchaea archaeon]